jgi:hypothetical protein
MTQQDYTALVFIVDRSGSMSRIAADMEGAISALLDSQKALPGKLTVDTVLFDDTVEFVHYWADPEDVQVRIAPRGSTALYDAIGFKVDQFGLALASMAPEYRPSKVIFAIVTDGFENASREHTADSVKRRITHQTEKYGWDFTYLGANQDAVLVAQTMGIAAGSALTWNTANAHVAAQTMDAYVTGTRTLGAYTYSSAERSANK